MTYVITRSCCSDAACVPSCPVDCIHPAPGEPGFETAEMLYIDPASCIECSACVQVCPVDAILPEEDLAPSQLPFLEINAAYYETQPEPIPDSGPATSVPRPPLAGLRVAIVGAGPAGSYAALDLLANRGVEVDVYERLMTPYGLVRAGVAPDHPATKRVGAQFPYQGRHPGLTVHFGVEVGRDISHSELLEHHHAVIYAVGASDERRLDIPGENLPGSHSATEFVAWYNGHPDASDLSFDLSGDRAVVVGNGNVALDVARILASDPNSLAKTDIADHALEALRNSAIREVVVLGRRGAAEAAYTTPELLDLTSRTDFDVATFSDEAVDGHQSDTVDPRVRMKLRIAQDLPSCVDQVGRRRVVLRYLHSPLEMLGDEQVSAVRLVRNEIAISADGRAIARHTEDETVLEAGLVLRAVGYRGSPVPGLPFDTDTGTVPNTSGRVHGEEAPEGAYVTGWIKRGPRGVIGTNKQCAAETVSTLAEDFSAGRLKEPRHDRSSLAAMLDRRVMGRAGLEGWAHIDAAERAAGKSCGRPRVKLTERSRLLDAARAAPVAPD